LYSIQQSIIFELMNDSIVSQGTKPNGTRNFHPKGTVRSRVAINIIRTTTEEPQPTAQPQGKKNQIVLT
jgi:hypothetical protein